MVEVNQLSLAYFRRHLPSSWAQHYSGGGLDLSTASGGFYGFIETGRSWYESAIRSQRVKDAVERNARAGKRTGGGSRPFGYKIIRHDLGEGGRRRYRIIEEEIEPAEAEAIKEAATRVLRGESIRSIAFDFNDRGIKPVAGRRRQGVRSDRAPSSCVVACHSCGSAVTQNVVMGVVGLAEANSLIHVLA
jgi:hypothetical protein